MGKLFSHQWEKHSIFLLIFPESIWTRALNSQSLHPILNLESPSSTHYSLLNNSLKWSTIPKPSNNNKTRTKNKTMAVILTKILKEDLPNWMDSKVQNLQNSTISSIEWMINIIGYYLIITNIKYCINLSFISSFKTINSISLALYYFSIFLIAFWYSSFTSCIISILLCLVELLFGLNIVHVSDWISLLLHAPYSLLQDVDFSLIVNIGLLSNSHLLEIIRYFVSCCLSVWFYNNRVEIS